jgi:hypothetical protein
MKDMETDAEEEFVDDLKVDRTVFSVVPLTEPDDSLAYWLSRPVTERLEALERLRRISYGPLAAARLQRVFEVVELNWR